MMCLKLKRNIEVMKNFANITWSPFYSFGILIIVCICFSACTTEQSKKTDQFIIPQKDTLHFEKTFFQRKSAHCENDTTACATVTIHAVKAMATNSKENTPNNRSTVLPFINDYIQKTIKEHLRWDVSSPQPDYPTVENLADAFIADYERDKNESPDDDTVQWSCSIDASVEHNTEHFITIKVSSYIYTGGAHPLQMSTYSILSTHSPKLIQLSDIISDTSTLKKIVELKLREKYDIPLYHDLRKHGFTLDSNSLPLTKNFSISREGLTFHYNPYDISPYSMGSHLIHLPYRSISPLLRSDLKILQ